MAGLGLGVALLASLTACGNSGGSGSGSGGGSGSGSSAPAGVVLQSGQGERLSGTYSASDFGAWLPQGLYPSDINEVDGGSYSTDDVVSVNAKYSLTSMSCSDTLQNAGGPGFGEEAYLIDQGENSAATEFYSYSVYEFPTAADATAFVEESAAKYAQCGAFTIQSTSGGSIQASLSVGPSSAAQVPDADASVDLRLSATVNDKTVLGENVLAADGNVVIYESSTSNTGALQTEVNLAKLAQDDLAAFAKGEETDVKNHIPSDYTTDTAAPTVPSDGSRIAGTSWGEAS